ncbi:TPA: hypothetical protein HA239_01550 [Candidatus Woesearchaeota archaeon]|nr:hypothetical protein [Candidatus Woesearchaeota archaeon]HIH41078.1 hypothetical protein [Candidatus Woesearchaeota archaeon]
MEKNMIITIVLVVLVIFSAAQAVQLNSLEKRIVSEGISPDTTKLGNSASGVNVPGNLNNLPQMVGGC